MNIQMVESTQALQEYQKKRVQKMESKKKFVLALQELRADNIIKQKKGVQSPLFRMHLRERKSEKTVWGMPLWHIGGKGICCHGLKCPWRDCDRT